MRSVARLVAPWVWSWTVASTSCVPDSFTFRDETEPEHEPTCGDGKVNATDGEECDDNDQIDGDGCDTNTGAGNTLFDCKLTRCGNGVIEN